MSLIQTLPEERTLLQELFEEQTLHSNPGEAGVGGKEPLSLSAALGWVDLKVAGMNALALSFP